MVTVFRVLQFSQQTMVDRAQCIRIPYEDDRVYKGNRIILGFSLAQLDGNHVLTGTIIDDDRKLLL